MSLLRRQRERQKRKVQLNNHFARASHFFFYISLQSLHDFHLKLISFMFYGQREQFSFSTRIFLFILYLTLPYSYCDTGKELNFTKRKEKTIRKLFLNKYFLLFLHFRTYSLTNQPEEGCCHLSSSVPVSVASGLVK